MKEQNYLFLIGFDFKGINNKINNICAGMENYLSKDSDATFYGNWLRQTKQVIKENPNIQYIRVKLADNFEPEELNIFLNYKTITVDQFKTQLNLS